MKPESTEVEVSLAGGKKITFETGKLAKQAHGSAVVRLGDNVGGRASISFPSRLIIASTHTPVDASPAASSSVKAVPVSAKFLPAA